MPLDIDIERDPHDQPNGDQPVEGLTMSGPGHSSNTQQATTRSEASQQNVSNRNTEILRRGRKRVKLMRMEVTCPVCQSRVVGSEDEVNEHINKCVEEKESREEVEEYEWAGYSKVRTTYQEATRLAGSGVLRIAHVSEAEEMGSLVDIEGDVNSMFGPVQYTVNGPVSATKESTNNVESSDSVPSSSTSTSPTTTTSTSPCPGSKCAVCLDPLINPLASVICWHVHCESCWMQALQVKKLCPRCTVITSFDDLRKVYL